MKIRNVATIIAALFVLAFSLYLIYVAGGNFLSILVQPLPISPAWQNIGGNIIALIAMLAAPTIVLAISLCTVRASGRFLLSFASAYTQRGDKSGEIEA